MLFKIIYFNKDADFSVSIISSDSPVNYKGMADVFGSYDVQKDDVFESIKAIKVRLRERIRNSRLSTDERYYKFQEVKDLTIDDLVDELLHNLYANETEFEMKYKALEDIIKGMESDLPPPDKQKVKVEA